MNSEFDALLRNQTWELVPPSHHLNVIGCRWIFKIKRKADGSIKRYKARLVAKGYHQQLGVDFHENYSPVVKPATIWLVLSIAVRNNWTIRQLDVQNAFLHGNLTEVVYMDQPPGFKHPQFPDHLCKLKRSLYGLKQAPHQWFSRLAVVLIQFGFVGSKADLSLFVHTDTSSIIYILIYVDDIIITGSNVAVITNIIQQLHKEFAITDLGPLSFFLGIEAICDATGLYLTQRRYIADLLTKSKMDGVNPRINIGS
jgi:histone deacetylase 1/2